MMRNYRTNYGGQPDVLEMGKALGLNQVNAEMVIPYMWVSVGASDPHSPSVILMVRGIQGTLRKLGIRTRGDGYIDSATAAALTRISGAHWKGKAWIQVIGDVLQRAKGQGSMGHYGSLGHYGHGYYGSLGNYGSLGADDFVTRGDICVPVKGPASDVTINLRRAKSLQHQINRVAYGLKRAGQTSTALIPEDGDIGPLTVGALRAVGPAVGLSAPPASCEVLVASLDEVGLYLAAKADGMNVPQSIPVPSGGPGRMVDPVTGKEEAAQAGIAGAIAGANIWLLAALGVGAALVYKASKKGKRKSKSRRRRRLPKTRTTVTRYR